MAKTVVPIVSERQEQAERRRAQVLSLPVPLNGEIRTENDSLVDRRHRPLRDIRISVTDHCNFRCRYCMPKEKFDSHHQFLTHTELLTFDEITRLVRIFVKLGVQKVRLTGGEPTLRKHLSELIARLKKIPRADGRPLDIAMTTNATLLERMADELKAAGLDRVTVSLDAVDETIFQSINDVGFPAKKVLDGIWAARDAGLPVKVNTVLKKGMNEGEIIPLVEAFRHTGVVLRFIEYMDAGTANGWRMDDVLPSATVVERINAVYPLEPLDPNYRGETAARWRFKDGGGEIGFISSVTQAFCKDCTRARLSVEGGLFLCLFADRGYDLRTMLRGGATDQEIEEAISLIWCSRSDNYSEIRHSGGNPDRQRIEMQYIGG